MCWRIRQNALWTAPSRPTTLPAANGSTISLTACSPLEKSAQDGGLRYVKQLKVRYGTFSHDADNVIVYEIDKVDAFLQFVFRGYSTEKEHLKKLGDNESSQRDCQILQLSQSGKSVREIASQVNCGKSTVNRIIQRSKESKNAGVPSVPLSQPLECGTMGQDGTADNQPSKTD